MERLYYDLIKYHLDNWDQMVFIEGPRQSGKTTLAKRLMLNYKANYYFNHDNLKDREIIISGKDFIKDLGILDVLSDEKPIIVFDEIHKFPNWKNYLKGIYDNYKDKIKIIATGSAKLTLYKKSQDSLMGRYFPYTIYPLSIGEIVNSKHELNELVRFPKKIKEDDYKNLYNFSGFPDPYFKSDTRFYLRWQKLRFEQLFRDDILNIEDIKNVSQLELLAHILSYQTSQQINYTSLAKKIQTTDVTIRKWISMLESFYFGFTVLPWHKNIVKAIIKEPKFYTMDWSAISDIGARAENFVACHLKKATKYWTDAGLGEFELYYIRTRDNKEVDFIVVKNNEPWFLVEVKHSEQASLSKHLAFFQEQTKAKHAFQVVLDMEYVDIDCFTKNIPIKVPAKTFLSQLV